MEADVIPRSEGTFTNAMTLYLYVCSYVRHIYCILLLCQHTNPALRTLTQPQSIIYIIYKIIKSFNNNRCIDYIFYTPFRDGPYKHQQIQIQMQMLALRKIYKDLALAAGAGDRDRNTAAPNLSPSSYTNSYANSYPNSYFNQKQIQRTAVAKDSTQVRI